VVDTCRKTESSTQDVHATVVAEVRWQRRSYNEAGKIALFALLFASDLDADQPLHTSRSSVSSCAEGFGRHRPDPISHGHPQEPEDRNDRPNPDRESCNREIEHKKEVRSPLPRGVPTNELITPEADPRNQSEDPSLRASPVVGDGRLERLTLPCEGMEVSLTCGRTTPNATSSSCSVARHFMSFISVFVLMWTR